MGSGVLTFICTCSQTRSVSGGGNWDVLHALVQERDPVPGSRIFEGGDSMDAMLGHG